MCSPVVSTPWNGFVKYTSQPTTTTILMLLMMMMMMMIVEFVQFSSKAHLPGKRRERIENHGKFGRLRDKTKFERKMNHDSSGTARATNYQQPLRKNQTLSDISIMCKTFQPLHIVQKRQLEASSHRPRTRLLRLIFFLFAYCTFLRWSKKNNATITMTLN